MTLLSGVFCFVLFPLQLRFFLQIPKSLGQLVLIRSLYLYLFLLWVLTFEWVLIAVPRESALHYDYLVSQDLTLKILFGVGFELFLSPKRQRDGWYRTYASSQANGSKVTTFLTFSYCNFLLEILAFDLKESQASRLISALIQHRDSFFPLLITDYRPNTEKMKEERTMWLHLFEGRLCCIPL